MTKSKSGPEVKADDPVADEGFQRVVKHFLTTPPNPHVPRRKGEVSVRKRPEKSGKMSDKDDS